MWSNIYIISEFGFVKFKKKNLDLSKSGYGIGPCLDAKFSPKFHYAKRRFPITLKCQHMHGVLNVDEIKN
jgi:hypothetical protein